MLWVCEGIFEEILDKLSEMLLTHKFADKNRHQNISEHIILHNLLYHYFYIHKLLIDNFFKLHHLTYLDQVLILKEV